MDFTRLDCYLEVAVTLTNRTAILKMSLACFILGLTALPAGASTVDQRVSELERQLSDLQTERAEGQRRQSILTEEIRKLKEARELPEKQELVSAYGLGPAASKVYGVEQGLSIGGYGQAWYSGLVDDKAGGVDNFDFKRLVLYTGYKFNDRLLFNSEIEFEHANSDTGSVSVELATLDFLYDSLVNFRAGMLLVPMGFLNEIHEPLFYHGNERPEIERNIIPSTWRENGAGIFGNLNDDWEYRAYVVSSLRGSRFSGSDLRGGRQKGSRSRAEDYSLVFRSDYQITPAVRFGGSVYSGDQGQGEALTTSAAGAMASPSIHTTVWEAHAEYRKGGLELRALAAEADVDDAAVLSAAQAVAGNGPVGSQLSGVYVEAAYDVMPLINDGSNQYLGLFVRREAYDTLNEVPAGFADDLSKDVELTTVGIDYKPDPQVVVKLDYRNFSLGAGQRPDEVNLGVGWVF